MFSNSLTESMLAASNAMQDHIDKLLPEDFTDSKLMQAMRYSSLSGGKRIRPFLVLATSNMLGIDFRNSLNAAAALEFIHTYSLIHDDLPAMDDDDFRRNQPSCHKQFDEATAILAGDGLLTLAFEILSDEKTHRDSMVRCELIKTLAKASGFRGMVGGQAIDLEKANQKIDEQELIKLHLLKTGELFMAATQFGAIIGGASESEKTALRLYASSLGLAFQIKDDILDYNENDSNKTKNDNVSIVDIIGIKQAQERLESLRWQAISHLQIFGDKAKLLIDLVDFVVN